jgi:hypothetical protein
MFNNTELRNELLLRQGNAAGKFTTRQHQIIRAFIDEITGEAKTTEADAVKSVFPIA